MNEIFQDIVGDFELYKWYFYDESGLENGPFNSEEQAAAALAAYIKYEINWEEDDPILKMRDTMGT